MPGKDSCHIPTYFKISAMLLNVDLKDLNSNTRENKLSKHLTAPGQSIVDTSYVDTCKAQPEIQNHVQE